jgi:hypothetical protein
VKNGSLESLHGFGRPLTLVLTLFLTVVPSTELVPLRFDSVVVVVEFFLGGRKESKRWPDCEPCVANKVPGRRTLYSPVNVKIIGRVYSYSDHSISMSPDIDSIASRIRASSLGIPFYQYEGTRWLILTKR